MDAAQGSTGFALSGLRFTEQDPSPALASHVLAFWSFRAGPDVEPHDHVVWPDGCVSVLVSSLSRVAVVFGPRTTPYATRAVPGMRVWGVRLWPDAGARILGIAAGDLRNAVTPAPTSYAGFRDILRGVDDEETAWPRMDAWWAARVGAWDAPDPRVRRAVGALAATAGTIQLADLAAESGVSARHLQRLFRDATGLTIKEYARIRRYRTALAPRLGSSAESWSQVAARFGYSDHAHLTRELRTLTGAPPSRAAERIAEIRHVNVKP
jgi:AraC-like DNA-binding protein